MMKRREFITLLGAATAWPLAARAQRTGKMSRIGYLGVSSPSLEPHYIEAFRQKLRDLGHIDGENIAIEYRWAEGHDDRLPDLATELVHLKPDVIVTSGTPGALAARRREGRYLLRTNLTENDPAQLWQYYTQLVAVEEAFRNLKGDLAIRPIFHQDEKRIEAHIFIAFLAYCMQITLTRRLHALAPGLTARSALEKFAAVQMIDLHLPTTDGREILLTRYTHPEPELQLLIDRLKLRLPPQPPPRITTAAVNQANRCSEDLLT